MMQRNTIEFSGSNSVIMSTGTELDTETSEENGLPGRPLTAYQQETCFSEEAGFSFPYAAAQISGFLRVLSPANRVRSIGKMRRIWENQPSCLRRWVQLKQRLERASQLPRPQIQEETQMQQLSLIIQCLKLARSSRASL